MNKKCTHAKISLQSVLSNNYKYSYCLNCGIIIPYHSYDKFIKPKSMEKRTDLDPLLLLSSMKEQQMVFTGKTINLQYLSNRHHVLSYLQDISLDLDYSDAVFYLALFYLDRLFQREEYQSFSSFENQKDTDLIITACLILAAKYYENDILEPELTEFQSSNKRFYLSKEDIKKSEVQVLRDLDYNLSAFTVYDYLMILLNNGFIFEKEIKDTETIQDIYSYAKKALAMITTKKLMLTYSPFQICISLLETTRDHFLFDKECFKAVLSMYDISFEDYEKCYDEVSDVMNETNRRLINRIKSYKDINKLEIESKEENKTKLKPISNKWSTPNNTINKTKGQFKIVRKGKDKSFKTVKIDNRLSINKLTKPIKNEYLSKPVISILNKKGSEDNTVTLSKQIPNAFFCNTKKRNELNFLGKISNVIKGKKEVVLPMIVQKSVINSYKDSVNGKRSAVNINHIDKM